MDSKYELGSWLLTEARLSFRYWHSSRTARDNMRKPFFDRNQADRVLDEYLGDDDEPLMAA